MEATTVLKIVIPAVAMLFMGEEAQWQFGVNTNGNMYSKKNGVQLASDQSGHMRPVARDYVTFMLNEGDSLGMSRLGFRLACPDRYLPPFDMMCPWSASLTTTFS